MSEGSVHENIKVTTFLFHFILLICCDNKTHIIVDSLMMTQSRVLIGPKKSAVIIYVIKHIMPSEHLKLKNRPTKKCLCLPKGSPSVQLCTVSVCKIRTLRLHQCECLSELQQSSLTQSRGKVLVPARRSVAVE